jgi:hypothetical protein
MLFAPENAAGSLNVRISLILRGPFPSFPRRSNLGREERA